MQTWTLSLGPVQPSCSSQDTVIFQIESNTKEFKVITTELSNKGNLTKYTSVSSLRTRRLSVLTTRFIVNYVKGRSTTYFIALRARWGSLVWSACSNFLKKRCWRKSLAFRARSSQVTIWGWRLSFTSSENVINFLPKMLELCPYDDLRQIIEKYPFWDPTLYDDMFINN